jgi:hypothetical protein
VTENDTKLIRSQTTLRPSEQIPRSLFVFPFHVVRPDNDDSETCVREVADSNLDHVTKCLTARGIGSHMAVYLGYNSMV